MEKYKFLLLFFIIIILLSSFIVQAESVKTVAIVEFKNTINYYHTDSWGLGQYVQDKLINILSKSQNFRVVEKETLDEIIDEQKFSLSGLVNESETAIELGKLIGADHIITGTIHSFNLSEDSFSGYDTKIYETTAKMESSIRLVNVTTGIIEVANSYKSQKKFQGKRKREVDIQSAGKELIEKIIDKFDRDINRYDFVSGEKKDQVLVTFKSEPERASVEIDSLYIGQTPIQKNLESGVHKIKITLGGYEPWEMKVKVSLEMDEINVNLGQKKE